MSKLKIRLMAALLALSASAVLAQSNDLEGRVDALEGKMDKILQLLQERQPTSERKSQQTSAAPRSDGFVPGLYADVYPPADKTLYEANGEREIPSGIPAASVAISPSSTLSYGEILKHDETKDFATRNRILPAIVFRGYVQIAERGRHALGFNFKMNDSNGCLVKLNLNDKSVVNRMVQNKSFYSNIPQLDLAPGFYKMDLYLECDNTFGNFPFDEQNVTMMLATPDDRAPKPALSSVFYIKQ